MGDTKKGIWSLDERWCERVGGGRREREEGEGRGLWR